MPTSPGYFDPTHDQARNTARRFVREQILPHIDDWEEATYRCAALVQAGRMPLKEVAMAKNFCAELAEQVTREAVQIHGGQGYMREATVERLSRDARLLAIGGGTTEIMKELIARQMGL